MASQLPVDGGEDRKCRPAPLAVHIYRDEGAAGAGDLMDLGEEVVDTGGLPGGREPPAKDIGRPLAPETGPDQECQLLELVITEEDLVGDVIAFEDIGVLKERLFGKSEAA